MKEYARFLTKQRAPAPRTRKRTPAPPREDVALEQPPQRRPRAFDRHQTRKPQLQNTHGTYVPETSRPQENPSLQDLAARNTKPNDVTAIPDSWDAKDRGTPPRIAGRPAARALVEGPPIPQAEGDLETKKTPGPKRKPRHKRRSQAISMSVSEEEEYLLRAHAAKKNKSFSEWARETLFRSMGRKIPSRS